MAKKYRPATMADIEERNTDLYMNGEQVWVLMIMRSQTIGEGEAKLDYIQLTNMKKVQVEDLQVIDDGEPVEPEGKDESPIMKQYRDIKAKHPDAMLLFRCGDFYECYQEDAREAAKILGITLTWRTSSKRHAPGDYTDAMAGFPHHALDTYLPRLVRAGKRVAICDQLPDPPKHTVKRGITELVKPGIANESNNNQTTSEDKSMKTNENNIESKNAAMQPQVDNNVTTDVDVAEVQDIMPHVTPRVKPEDKPAENTGRTKVVVAGVPKPGEKADSRKVQDSVPQDAIGELVYEGRLRYETYDKKKTAKATGKEYTVTHAKIMGFSEADEAYQRGAELHGAASGETVDGKKVLGLYFSHRYAAAAKLVCEALNAGRPFADCVAIIDNATEENAKRREEWKAKLSERKARREEREAAKADKKADKKTDKKAAPADAKEQQMFELFKKFMSGDKEAMEQVGAMMMKHAA